ncbi:MAG TPA: hypothetical protein VIH57_19175, partial [Bacteroidales bacterium]
TGMRKVMNRIASKETSLCKSFDFRRIGEISPGQAHSCAEEKIFFLPVLLQRGRSYGAKRNITT